MTHDEPPTERGKTMTDTDLAQLDAQLDDVVMCQLKGHPGKGDTPWAATHRVTCECCNGVDLLCSFHAGRLATIAKLHGTPMTIERLEL